MRVAQHVVDARRDRLAFILSTKGYLSVPQLCQELDVSEATVRRDLEFLSAEGKVTRTYGGVIGDANLRFPSHQQRLSQAIEAKKEIGQRALEWVKPGMVVFFDGGSTLHYMIKALQESTIRDLTCVTISLPAVDLLSSLDGITVHLLGGRLYPRQSVLLGENTSSNIKDWEFDLALLCAQGMTDEGLWNTNPEVVKVQRQVYRHSLETVVLIDDSKLGKSTEHFLFDWKHLDGLLTNADKNALLKAGIPFPERRSGRLKPDSKKRRENDLTLPTSLL